MVEVLDDDLEILTEIGRGSWSVVKQGFLKSISRPVAVKVESHAGKATLLLREAKIMKHLQGIEGIPTLYKSGSREGFNYIAMQKLHCTLDLLRKQGLLRLDDVLKRADQLLLTMEQVHMRGILHQDLQPKNLMTSNDYLTTFYIDFGLAKTLSHQSTSEPKMVGMLGTPSFSSFAALLEIEQDRKDDLESLGYNLVWLIRGELPWEAYAREGNLANLKSVKLQTPVSVICQGCPEELIHYINYVKGLQFRDLPDYNFLRSLIECAWSRHLVMSSVPLDLSSQPKNRQTSMNLTTTSRQFLEPSKPLLKGLNSSTATLSLKKQAYISGLKPTEDSTRQRTSANHSARIPTESRNGMTSSSKLPDGIGSLSSLSKFNLFGSRSFHPEWTSHPEEISDIDLHSPEKFSPAIPPLSPRFGVIPKSTETNQTYGGFQKSQSSPINKPTGSTKQTDNRTLASGLIQTNCRTIEQSLGDIRLNRNGSQTITLCSPVEAEHEILRMPTTTMRFPNLNAKTRAAIAEFKAPSSEKQSQCSVF